MNITPFVKRMRTQGGTMYTFSSAVEDIGLNINERNNIVKMSNFALLNIPDIKAPDNLQQNRFNVFAIDGALKNYENSGSIKDGRVVIAESFQNYALNLETNLLSSNDYNPALLRTVPERVFWKWIKESGAVRWTKDVSNNNYWIEEIDTDSSVGYNSVVKYVGEISAGSVRTNTFGTYNETYVLVPTSHGQTRVYFKQIYDDNYKSSMKIGPGDINILGRESYLQPHPDGLSLKADYDVIDSSTISGGWSMSYDTSDGSGYQPGWWYTAQEQSFVDENWYTTDVSTVLDSSLYNYKLKYEKSGEVIEFQRSNVDALEIEYNINNLKTIFGDSTLTFDKMAIEDSIDDHFEFNAVLIYYRVYNKTLDKILATNLLGVLFLDAPSGNTVGFMEDMEITIPTISKLQSISTGFGSSYSFRINIKSDNMIDDTQATIFDESTSSQVALENWGSVLSNLEQSLNILNTHTGTINYITEQYMDVKDTQTQQGNSLTDLQYQINDLETLENNLVVNPTPGMLSMFNGDEQLVDSSIFMNIDNNNIGVFTKDPSYPFHVDSSMKTYDIIIENAVRDVSGNILLGYGSPLQIGSTTNYREVDIYTGNDTPALHIYENNNLDFDGSVVISGNLSAENISANIIGYVSDASLSEGDVQISGYFKESSIGSGLSWNGSSLLDVSIDAITSAVTEITDGNGMFFSDITATGSIVLGTPSSLTLTTTNDVTANSHTHRIDINRFVVDTSGLVPGPVAENGYFLRDDGTWVSVSAGGTVTSIAVGSNLTITAGSDPITTTGTISHATGSGNNHIPVGGAGDNYLRWSSSGVATWSSGGAGSGLNADTLDNYHESSFTRKGAAATITANWAHTGTLTVGGNSVLTTGDEGTLDAGTLDNYDSSDFPRKAEDAAVTGTWTFDSSVKIGGSSTPSEALEVDGNIIASGEITAHTSSDERFKDHVQNLENTLEIVNNLRPVSFEWNETAKKHNSRNTGSDIGLIAQETEEFLPEVVHEMYDKYKGIDYAKIVPILIGAIQEQQAQINHLKEIIIKK